MSTLIRSTSVTFRLLSPQKTSWTALRKMSNMGYGNQDAEDPKKKQKQTEKEFDRDSTTNRSTGQNTKSSVETPVSSDVGGSQKLPKSSEDPSNSVRKNIAHED